MAWQVVMCPVVLWCGQDMELHCRAWLGRSGQFVAWQGYGVYPKAEQAGESVVGQCKGR